MKYATASVLLLSAALAHAADRPCNPAECDVRARAAFAFAKAKKPTPAGAAVAPMPREASVSHQCVCGSECKCKAGVCPNGCPTGPKPSPAPERFRASDGREYEKGADGVFRPLKPVSLAPAGFAPQFAPACVGGA